MNIDVLLNMSPEEKKKRLSRMSRKQKEELNEQLLERERRVKQRKILTFYPETGPLRRELYVPHMKFFQAGGQYRERGMMSANRVGKTEGVGGYETTHHLTGQYPDWWKEEDGYKKFNHPIRAWAAGDTNETTKDILQAKLCGPIMDIGSGLIPGESIVDWKRKAGSVPDTIESVYVQHVTNGVKDGISVLKFKSYEQTRKSFQGTEQHVILLDEESPASIYHECLMRTMATGGFEGGIIMLTFTPLLGMSEVVLMFMPDGKMPDDFKQTGKYLVGATWDDAPHLSKEEKEALWAALPPHQRDARSRGIPQLGSGAIYPIQEEDLLEDDFPIPDHWSRAYGFDHGWNATAALWGAWDMEPAKPILHLYSEYKRGQAEPEVHASNVKTRGDWICGVSDPSKGTSSRDGEQLLMTYKTLLPGLQEADNAVEAGLFDAYMLMTQGRLKVFRSLTMWLGEFRMYRRDENGKVVKENDHLMDTMRYLVRSGRKVAKIMPIKMFAERNISQDDYDPLNFGLGVG